MLSVKKTADGARNQMLQFMVGYAKKCLWEPQVLLCRGFGSGSYSSNQINVKYLAKQRNYQGQKFLAAYIVPSGLLCKNLPPWPSAWRSEHCSSWDGFSFHGDRVSMSHSFTPVNIVQTPLQEHETYKHSRTLPLHHREMIIGRTLSSAGPVTQCLD